MFVFRRVYAAYSILYIYGWCPQDSRSIVFLVDRESRAKLLHPGKLTWRWKNNHLKMYLLLRMVIFHCHVSFSVVYFSLLLWGGITVTFDISSNLEIVWNRQIDVAQKTEPTPLVSPKAFRSTNRCVGKQQKSTHKKEQNKQNKGILSRIQCILVLLCSWNVHPFSLVFSLNQHDFGLPGGNKCLEAKEMSFQPMFLGPEIHPFLLQLGVRATWAPPFRGGGVDIQNKGHKSGQFIINP